MRCNSMLLAGCWLGLFASDLSAQAPRKVGLAGEDRNVAARLQAVDRLVDPLATPEMLARAVALAAPTLTWLPAYTASLGEANQPQNWEQAIEEYERLIHDSEDALVPIGQGLGPTPSVQVRRLAHARLARLPRSLLAGYRKRVDAAAKRLLQEGRENLDPAPLRRLVDDMFCSRPTEDALDLLGDLAFERGQFAEARCWWSLLIEPLSAPGDPSETRLLFPGLKRDPALIHAKQILADIFSGDSSAAVRELSAFRRQHGAAKGQLAGRTGELAEILADLASQAASKRRFRGEGRWETFAGTPMRQHALPEPLPGRLWAEGPTWRLRLPLEFAAMPKPGLGRMRQPAFHPIVVEDQVILADARAVWAYDLLTGKPRWEYSLSRAGLQTPDAEELKKATELPPAYTLSASDGRIFARLGKPTIRTPEDGEKIKLTESHLVCLDAGAPAGTRKIWHATSRWPSMFEGAPIVFEDGVYIAETKVEGQRTQTALVCFQASTGRRRWSQPVCDSGEFEDGQSPRARHHLLTLAGGQLVYCSHAGAVVAVDPRTGRRLWGLRYPSRGRFLANGSPSPRDLAPCLFHHDRIYAAPLDSDRLLCISPVDGTVIWTRPAEVVHLLGVVDDRLFFTTPDGIRAIHTRHGTDEGGWMQPAVGKLPGLGRGLLMGDCILWPTQDSLLPLRMLSQKDGSQETPDGIFLDPTQLRGLLPGNMIFANGCLVVAGREELAVYVAPRLRIKHLESVRDRSAADRYRWAMALADAGRNDADAELAELARLGPDWKKLIEQTKSGNRPRSRDTELLTYPALSSFKKPPAFPEAKVTPPWHLPLLRHWEAPQAKKLLTSSSPRWNAGFFLAADGKRVSGRKLANGQELWTQSVPFEPTWADSENDVVILAGPDGVQAVRAANGEPLWYFPSPALATSFLTLRDNMPTLVHSPGGLDEFQLAAGRLTMRHDRRRLFAIDVYAGKMLWNWWAPGGDIRPLESGGLIHANATVTPSRLLAQTSDGVRWLFDAKTGQVLDQTKCRPEPFPRPWLKPDGSSACLAEPGGSITSLDLETGKILWQFNHPFPTSLTGAPGRLLGTEDAFWALLPMNQGTEIWRLDFATGKPLSSEPILIAGAPSTFAGWDAISCYQIHATRLISRSLAAGKTRWEIPLPALGENEAERQRISWQIHSQGDCLLLCPDFPPALPWLPTPGNALSFPLMRRLTPMPPPEFALWVIDSRDGRLLQCLAQDRGDSQVLIAGTGFAVRSRGGILGYFPNN